MRSTHSLTVISLGGGVQSSVMSFMASGGAFGAIPDCAIFADTHWEPSTIYTHLDWLSRNLSFPLYVVDNGRSLREDAKALTNHSGNRGLIDLPLYLKGPARAGERNGQGDGMGRRQCAEHCKIRPVRRKIRELLGLSRGQRVPADTTVELWLGISTDEAIRMKTSSDRWIHNRYPLIAVGCPERTAWSGGRPATTNHWSVRPASAAPTSPARGGPRRSAVGLSCLPRWWRSTPTYGASWPSPRSPTCILDTCLLPRPSTLMRQGCELLGTRTASATSARVTVASDGTLRGGKAGLRLAVLFRMWYTLRYSIS